MDLKEAKSLAKENDLKIAVVGNRVFEASQYAPELRVFPTKKWLFLNHYADEMPLSEAADKVGMTVEEAERFLETDKAKEWLERRAVIQYAKQKWSDGGEWVVTGEECLEGKKHLAKDQQIVFQAFGERFMPKAKTEQKGNTTINFNFSAEAVKAAIERQTVIDAEVA
jgi:hypothetical protein